MRELPYESRQKPFFEAELPELFSEVSFLPFNGNRPPAQRPGWLHLFTYSTSLDSGDYANNGWFHVKATSGLATMIGRRSIFSDELATLADDHGLTLSERDGKLFLGLQFQKISGYYTLCELPAEEFKALLGRAKESGHAQL